MKLHKIINFDELRPALNHVYIKDGFAVVTDSHILIKVPLSLIFSNNEKDSALPNMFISQSDWAKIFGKKFQTYEFEYKNEYLTVHLHRNTGICDKVIIKPLLEKDADFRPVNFGSVLPKDKDSEAVEDIGINAEMLNNISIATEIKRFRLKFNGKDRAIFIIPVDTDYQNIKIILMPILGI